MDVLNISSQLLNFILIRFWLKLDYNKCIFMNIYSQLFFKFIFYKKKFRNNSSLSAATEDGQTTLQCHKTIIYVRIYMYYDIIQSHYVDIQQHLLHKTLTFYWGVRINSSRSHFRLRDEGCCVTLDQMLILSASEYKTRKI